MGSIFLTGLSLRRAERHHDPLDVAAKLSTSTMAMVTAMSTVAEIASLVSMRSVAGHLTNVVLVFCIHALRLNRVESVLF